jgi:hypothetical protein
VRWEERTIRLFEGQRALSVGLVAVFVLALLTVFDRWLSVPFLYDRPMDAFLHLSAEFLAGGFAWLLCWSSLTLGTRATRAVTSNESRQLATRVGVTVLLGIVAGIAMCDAVPRHSAYWGVAPPVAWWLGSMTLGATASSVVFRLLRRPVPARARPIGVLIAFSALALHLASMRDDFSYYGNLLALLQTASPVLFAVGVTLYLSSPGLRARVSLVALVACALSLLLVTLASPSNAARRAVLVSGATAKHWILRILWPALDKDGDGAPRRLWGSDPDDRDPSVTPLLAVPPVPLDGERIELAPSTGQERNVLFVVVDTVRTDSFERLLESDAGIRDAFAPFAFHAGYSSCSSRTYLVFAQLLDGFRCDPRRPSGTEERSLLGILRSRGFRDELYGYYGATVSFKSTVRIANDEKLVAATLQALDEPSSTPRFVVVHLKGGHGEYDAPGSTPRERYENQLARSLRQVGALARKADPSRWVMIVVGDHGEAFGEHDSVAHATTLYEEVLRTPFLIRAPNLTAGRYREALGCSDVAWHVLHGAGMLERPSRALPFQYALLDLARARGARAQRDSIRSLRRGGYKLLWRPQLGVFELYDLERDPGELRNLVESHPDEARALRSELARLSETCTVPPWTGSPESSSTTTRP